MRQRESFFLMINFFLKFFFSSFLFNFLTKKKYSSDSLLSSSHTSCLSTFNIVIFDIHIETENHSPHFFLHYNLKQLDIYFFFGFHHQLNLVWGSVLTSNGFSSLSITVAGDQKIEIRTPVIMSNLSPNNFNISVS
jgi:hypothetical protein